MLAGSFSRSALLLLQGYGQTEAGPVISATPPEAIRIDTVGPPLLGVELRLADDGEILVRGDLVMDGYWGRPEDTALAIQDGWLHTGDIGSIDERGNLRITDRKKDMIVLSGGENVSPAKIEGMLMAEPEIAQAVVAGDGRAGLTALLVAGRRPRRGIGRAGVDPHQSPAVGHRADSAARAWCSLHGREWIADADAQNPPADGHPRQRRH